MGTSLPDPRCRNEGKRTGLTHGLGLREGQPRNARVVVGIAIGQLVAPRTGTPRSEWGTHTDHLPRPWTASPTEQDLVFVRDGGFLQMSFQL